MPKRRAVAAFLVRGVLLATIATLAFGAPALAQPFRLNLEDFPNTGFPDAGLGEPYLVMYDDGDFLASLSYRYSQRHHDSPWLVVTLRIARSDRVWRNLEIRRDDIVLIRPDGVEVPPATQRERRGDSEGLRELLNERANWPETLRFDFPGERTRGGYYFLQRDLRFEESGVRFETRRLPVPAAPSFVPGPVSRAARSAGNDVFFVSPDGSWEAGVHALVVTIDDRTIKLPVWLRQESAP